MTTEANEDAMVAKEEADAAAHRAFVREIHSGLAGGYGFGGGLVLVGVLGVLAAFWWFGTLLSPIPWLLAITGGLAGLLTVRWIVYRRVERYWSRLQSYCEANDLEAEQLREYYGGEEMYPFFGVLFELKERREKLRAEQGEAGELADESERSA